MSVGPYKADPMSAEVSYLVLGLVSGRVGEEGWSIHRLQIGAFIGALVYSI